MTTLTQKFNITLLGRSYTIVTDESERDLAMAAQQLDETMKQIVAATSVVDVQKVAVLAALKIALSQVQLEQKIAVQADQQAKLMDLISHVDL
jgi:cell division protein ZapA (FtsZ GTPase activity inhibitor)